MYCFKVGGLHAKYLLISFRSTQFLNLVRIVVARKKPPAGICRTFKRFLQLTKAQIIFTSSNRYSTVSLYLYLAVLDADSHIIELPASKEISKHTLLRYPDSLYHTYCWLFMMNICCKNQFIFDSKSKKTICSRPISDLYSPPNRPSGVVIA